jgi:prolyl-tRNA editing enzyme YbaK/EbsC (Cys-tRNA(Pro) deacylase)
MGPWYTGSPPAQEAVVRTCSDVHNFLTEQGVAHEIVRLPALSTTARRAADLLGVPLGEVVKSLLFLLDGSPTLVLLPGDRSADPARLKELTGCTKAVLARGDQVLDVTGYRVGAVPPCGLATDLPVIADEAVFTPPVVYCGGGAEMTMLKLRSEDLRRLLPAKIAEISDTNE